MDKTDNAGSSCSCSPDPQIQSCSGLTDNPQVSEIRVTDSTITFANRLDHFLARWGWKRESHRVEPGLYRLGNPNPDSPVFASANYTLSFDALRSALAGTGCMDPRAGYQRDQCLVCCRKRDIRDRGTGAKDRMYRSSRDCPSPEDHRTRSWGRREFPGRMSCADPVFRVEYGPVRAKDLPEYLKTHKATPAMRRVEFPLKDRLVLTPVEFVHTALPMVIVAALLWFLAGPVAALAAVSAVLAGTVLFPVLLPFIPTQDFSTKGLILGLVIAIPFAVSFGTNPMPARLGECGGCSNCTPHHTGSDCVLLP